jgi:HTH-type transcriptional regulator/antitoxin MqsA
MMKCPICGKADLVHETRDLHYTYKGKTTTIGGIEGDFCRACNEGILYPEGIDRFGQLAQEFQRQVNAELVNPEFILNVRKKLGLGQREAGEIFGGGVNAFSRYENAKAEPPVSLIKLLKLLDKHPKFLNEIADYNSTVEQSLSRKYQKGSLDQIYEKKFDFDPNQVDRIFSLLILKDRCLRHDTSLRLHFGCLEPAFTFFGGIAVAVDSIMVAQINDEVAACMDDRGPTKLLLQLAIDKAKSFDFEVPALALDDMQSLFRGRADLMIGSCFLDFLVGTYSVFEMFIGQVYDSLRLKHPRSNGKKKRVEGLIRKYVEATTDEKESFLDDIIKAGGDHVSGREKIEFVMSKLPASYSRDLARDRELIKFYSSARNTVHNLGKSSSSTSLKISLPDGEISLPAGGRLQTSDFSNIVKLCSEIVEIYFAICTANIDLGQEPFVVTS